jgi:hypothetical protein
MAGAIAAGMRNLDPTGITQTIFITKMIATVLSGMARAKAAMDTKNAPQYNAPPPPQFKVEGGQVKKYARGGRLRGPGHSDASGGLHIVDPYTGQVQATAEGDEVLLSKEVSRINAPIVNALLRKSLSADRTPLNLAGFARENQMQRGGLFGNMKTMFKEGRKRQYDNTQNERIEQNSKDVSNMNKMLADMTAQISGLRADLNGGKIKGSWDWERYNEGKDDMAEIERKAGYVRN